MNKWFEQFTQLSLEEEKIEFKNKLEAVGFTAMNQLIQDFYEKLKNMDELEFDQIKKWLQWGSELFPNLSVISPSWENTWQDLAKIYDVKVGYFMEIPKEQRDGEWQVLFDNPFSTEGVVCHPRKTFNEATYLAAKYQLYMKKAEIVELQKIQLCYMKRG
ncbi:hypothetical protein TEPIDINF_001236 [Tepidibacillus infernus]|uniref:hypothetical protein n=1 Tax=Tepidibacillus infernus TaxID=1806172 RepID=UPI003B70C235